MHRALSLLLLLAAPTALADAAEEVRQSEVAFAKAFADRDPEAFFRLVADDANFLDARNTLAGKQAVMKAWAGLFKPKDAPFSWKPERVVTNAAGTLGLSTGSVFDREGKRMGSFSSVWMKQADGTWRVVFDGPGAPAPAPCPAVDQKQAGQASP